MDVRDSMAFRRFLFELLFPLPRQQFDVVAMLYSEGKRTLCYLKAKKTRIKDLFGL